jgi:UDP-N-acetylmuramoyl-tripeptide--D-alanyl-D-alanine ligase
MKAALANFKPGANRMNMIPLREGGMVIDDTYNANPVSVLASLEACRNMAQGRKMVAVLGDMLELGAYEREGHLQVGQKAAEIELDILVTIGESAQYYREGAIERGMSETGIFHFGSREEALHWMKGNISPTAVVLFKASRGMQLDKLVSEWLVLCKP